MERRVAGQGWEAQNPGGARRSAGGDKKPNNASTGAAAALKTCGSWGSAAGLHANCAWEHEVRQRGHSLLDLPAAARPLPRPAATLTCGTTW